MNSTYKVLFSITFLHDYYLDRKCDDFDVVPDSSTQTLLSRYRLIYKVVGNRVVVLTEIDDTGGAFKSIDTKEIFRFYLILRNVNFGNISCLKIDRSKKYYFNNLTSNAIGSNLFLSKIIPTHVPTSGYAVQDLVTNGSEIFECISSITQPPSPAPPVAVLLTDATNWMAKPNLNEFDLAKTYKQNNLVKSGGEVFVCLRNNVSGRALTDVNNWKSLGRGSYVTETDSLSAIASVSNFTTAAAAKIFSIEAFSFNSATNNFDLPLKLDNDIQVTNEPTRLVHVNIGDVPAGRYRVKLNTEDFFVLVDNEAIYSSAFGVVEIYNHLADGNSFALRAVGGSVKETSFTIQFANKLAKWKYIALKQAVASIADSTAAFSFAATPALPSAPQYFISNKPVPLMQSPRMFQVVLATPLGEPPPAPNPSPYDAAQFSTDGDHTICSIYLNY